MARSPSASARSSTAGVDPGRYDVAFRLEANTWNGTTAPQLVVRRIFESPERYRVLRAQFAAEWRAGPEQWSETERAVFEELGLEESGWRSLLESETFRALLEPEAARTGRSGLVGPDRRAEHVTGAAARAQAGRVELDEQPRNAAKLAPTAPFCESCEQDRHLRALPATSFGNPRRAA